MCYRININSIIIRYWLVAIKTQFSCFRIYFFFHIFEQKRSPDGGILADTQYPFEYRPRE